MQEAESGVTAMIGEAHSRPLRFWILVSDGDEALIKHPMRDENLGCGCFSLAFMLQLWSSAWDMVSIMA